MTTKDKLGAVTAYAYDAAGNVTKVTDNNLKDSTYAYDENGNVTKYTNRENEWVQYDYDCMNRLVKETNQLHHATETAYDLCGNVTSVTDGNKHATVYTYDGLNRVASKTSAEGSVTEYAYHYLGGIETLTVDGGNGTRTTTVYAYDETLGLYFAQNRFYAADLHRFTQEDVIKDGANWYAYCGSNPRNSTDAWGLAYFQLYELAKSYGARYPNNTVCLSDRKESEVVMKSSKKWITLLFAFSLVFLATSCKRQYDMTYCPWEEEHIEQYVWASEKYAICFLDSDLGTVGVMEFDGDERLICVSSDPGYFYVDEYKRGFFVHHKSSSGFAATMNGERIIYTGQPKYKEGKFTIRVPLKFGQPYAGKKITFTRYEKDTVQPSDFGFDYESWDDLVSQFELVDADTGETVSLDVLK